MNAQASRSLAVALALALVAATTSASFAAAVGGHNGNSGNPGGNNGGGRQVLSVVVGSDNDCANIAACRGPIPHRFQDQEHCGATSLTDQDLHCRRDPNH